MKRPRDGHHGHSRLGAYCRDPNDSAPSDFITYAVPVKDIFMLALGFSTPALGCYDIFHIGSQTTNQHSVEVGLRASTVPSQSGQFYLTVGFNGVADGNRCYREYPPTYSGLGLQIEKDTVYSVLIILDFKHALISYYDIDPSYDVPFLLYNSKIQPYLFAENLRSFGVSHRLELKESNNQCLDLAPEFSFPGTISHCYQWQIDFPGDVVEWQNVVAAGREQDLKLTVLAHRQHHIVHVLLETRNYITRHCLSLLDRVSMLICFEVSDRFINVTMHAESSRIPFQCVTSQIPVTATEATLFSVQQSLCSGQVTPWFYVHEAVLFHVPCARAHLPSLIGGLIPHGQKCLKVEAFFWKLK
jgi:hypothetical protein